MNLIYKEEFDSLPLFAHQFLADVPLRSLYRLRLDGGRAGMTVLEIKEAIGFDTEQLQPGGLTKFLFWLRGSIGSLFAWDEDNELAESVSFLQRLTPEERSRSRVESGEKEGISRILYCFENEFAAEIVNRTVHCFWVMASKQVSEGYELYMAVYVRKLNWFTPIYMAVVTPMLKWIVYPALNRSAIMTWNQTQQPRSRTNAGAVINQSNPHVQRNP